jgi:hypothetical protein
MVGVVKSRQGGQELDSRKTDTGIFDAPELRALSFSLNAAAGDLKTIWSLAIEVRTNRHGTLRGHSGKILEAVAGRSWNCWLPSRYSFLLWLPGRNTMDSIRCFTNRKKKTFRDREVGKRTCEPRTISLAILLVEEKTEGVINREVRFASQTNSDLVSLNNKFCRKMFPKVTTNESIVNSESH